MIVVHKFIIYVISLLKYQPCTYTMNITNNNLFLINTDLKPLKETQEESEDSAPPLNHTDSQTTDIDRRMRLAKLCFKKWRSMIIKTPVVSVPDITNALKQVKIACFNFVHISTHM